MKSKIHYFLLSVIVLASGCSSSSKSSAPVPVPSGNFAGQFRLVHTSAKSGTRDTMSANIQLTLNTTTGFAVTGDTSKVHAGSYGGYAISANYIQFNDVTYPKTGTPTKVHLEGAYQYYYDGNVFQMLASSAVDTLSYQYDLKRSN